MAIAECQAAVQNDSRFNSARNSSAQEAGKGVYKVTGMVKDERGRNRRDRQARG